MTCALEFGAYRLDTVSHRLWRGDERVPLTPKAFDLLRYLAEHRDRLVGQREILDVLWPGTHVNPEVVKKQILEIRKALGDRARPPAFIETFPKRGYQFVAAVRDGAAPGKARAPVAHSRPTMVGRAAAIAELERCLERALDGERQLVFVTGEAGLGKTTLVDAFLDAAAGRGPLHVARGQCIEGFAGRQAFYPVLEALGDRLRDGPGGAVAQALVRHAPTWRIQFPALVSPGDSEALAREVLGTTPARMLREAGEALEALAAERAFVLVLEDLHWCDRSTFDLLSALARRRGPAKLLVVCTYRPEDVAGSDGPLQRLQQDLLVHGLCRELALERLAGEEVAEYLDAELGGHGSLAGVAEVIHRRCDGNPLFMAALVQDLVRRGLVQRSSGVWQLQVPLADLSLAVPDSLRRLLELHFDALSPSEQRLLTAASVAGERFALWALEAAAELDGEEVERLCEGLAGAQRLIRAAGLHPLADGRLSAHYEFRHALYRQVVYERTSELRRARMHGAIGAQLRLLCSAQHLELAAEVALHLERAGERRDAIGFLILAADNADRRFAYRESIQFLQHALRLAPAAAPAARAELEVGLHERIGDAHFWLGSMHESAKAYEAEAARADEAGLRAAQVRALSHLVRPFGLIDPDRGIAAIERAQRLSAGLRDPLLQAQTELLAAGTRLLYDAWRRSDWDLCVAAREAILALDRSGLPAYHRMIYAQLKALQGHFAEALRELEAGIPTRDEPTSPMVHLFALSGKTLALLSSGRLAELSLTLRAGRETAERNGNPPWLFLFREARLRAALFDFEGALALCRAATAAEPECPDQPETIARLAAGHLALERGQLDEAERCFDEIRDPGVTAKFFLHWTWRMSAQLGLCDVWLASGNAKRARAEADAAVAAAAAIDEPNLRALAHDARARVALAGRAWKSAADDVESGLALVQEFEIPTVAWRLHATAAELRRRSGHEGAAGEQRAKAEAIVLRLAGAFPADEPMRRCLLGAAAARGIRE